MCMASCGEKEMTYAYIEGLDDFCRAVELYNTIVSGKAPLFLKRCLRYLKEERNTGRIKRPITMTVGLDTKSENQSVLPVCVVLGKKVSDQATTESVFQLVGRARMLYTNRIEGKNQVLANFQLPELDELSNLDSASRFIIFISSDKLTLDCMDLSSFPSNVEGDCLVGKISIDLLSKTWSNYKGWSLGQIADTFLGVNLLPHRLKPSLSEGRAPSFQLTVTRGASDTPEELRVVVCAWELGVKGRNPYDSYAWDAIPSDSSQKLVRLRRGNVVFNYRQHDNKLLTSEVTEDFSCPFCLMKCVNFKGLKCHLFASHDLFKYEFSVTEKDQCVDVSTNFDTWTPKIIGCGVEPQKQTFIFCAKSLRRKKLKTVVQDAKHIHRPSLDLDLNKAVSEHWCKMGGNSHTNAYPDFLQSLSGSSLASPTILQDDSAHSDIPVDHDCVQSVPESSLPLERVQHVNALCGQDTKNEDPDFVQSAPELQLPPPEKLQDAKTNLVASVDNDSINLNLTKEGKFFHSQSGQPMTLEEVLSNHNSEDEIDDVTEDIEERRMLSDFTDVSKGEKHMMHLWNSFVKRNRIRFRCHIPWACEAFIKLHGPDFVQAPPQLWYWRMFMVHLCNRGLLEAEAMHTYNVILDEFRHQRQELKSLKTKE